jgi:hypothetical protein
MGVKVVFSCDHADCTAEYTIDTSAKHRHGGGLITSIGQVDTDMPLNLSPVVRFLTDPDPRGGGGWGIALDRMPDGLMLIRKCFCPKHEVDLKTMSEYVPDGLAKERQRKERKQ